MGAVFVSYRRGDSEGQARALAVTLAGIIGRESVFIDVDNIALGRDFRQVLQERLNSCDLMLVLIGRDWLDSKDASGNRRLDDQGDYVRQEIAAALKRNIPVTPVLLQGAQVPAADRLPENLKDLAFRNGIELSHSRWESDVNEMVTRMNLRRHPERSSRLYWYVGIGMAGLALLLTIALTIRGRQSGSSESPSDGVPRATEPERNGNRPPRSPSSGGDQQSNPPGLVPRASEPTVVATRPAVVTAATTQTEMTPLMESLGYYGGTDYRNASVGSPAECAALCNSEPQCVAMTFILSAKICYLKNALTATAASPDMVSARKREH